MVTLTKSSDPEPAPGSKRNWPLVSILIVNYNGAEVLPGCLNSLRKITFGVRA